MTESEVKDLSLSITDLVDAFNDLEAIVGEYGVMTWRDYHMEYPDFARMCSDCIFLYNECERIIDNFGGHLNRKQLDYLRYLRINCAHYCGSTRNNIRYYEAVYYVIIPMKEKIRSMLYEVIEKNGNNELTDAVKQFNRKKRSFFKFR